MGADFPAARLDHEAADRGDGDGGGQDGKEGKPADAGQGRKLDERDIPMQCDAERVPTEAGEHVAAEEFQSDPGGRGDQPGAQVPP